MWFWRNYYLSDTDDSQYINQLSYDYLKQKDIILLEDFFREFRNKDVFIYLDIKGSYKVSYPLIDMLKKWFSQDSLKKYVSGFDRKFVDVFIDSQLPIHLGFLLKIISVEQLKQLPNVALLLVYIGLPT